MKHQKLLIVFMIIMFFSLSFVNAQWIEALKSVKPGDNITLVQTSSIATSCNVTQITPPSQIAYIVLFQMARTDPNFNYNFTIPNINTSLGDWTFTGRCSNTTHVTDFGYHVPVTYTGKEFTQAQANFYFILFGVLLFLFIITVMGIAKLPSENATDPEDRILKISNLKYLRIVLWFVAWWIIIAMIYISSNLAFAYLQENLFAKFLFILFRVMLGLTPIFFIIWFIWLITRVVDDQKIKKLWSRGMLPSTRDQF